MANTSFDLERFVKAQDPVYRQVCDELRSGHKRSHWMWFIFPQIKGLGISATARKYAISSREEAQEYVNHPVLGPRLVECTRLACSIEGRSIRQIFGYPDDLKFRSSMTLFANVASNDEVFQAALRKFFVGEPDRATLDKL